MSDIDDDFIKEEEEENEKIVIQAGTEEELSTLTKNLCGQLIETQEDTEKESIENVQEKEVPPNLDSNLNEKNSKSPKLSISTPELSETFHPPLSPTVLISSSQNSSPVSLSLQHYESFDIRPILITVVKSPLNSNVEQENKMPPLNNRQLYAESRSNNSKSKRAKSVQRSYKKSQNYNNKESERVEIKEALERFITKNEIPDPNIRSDVVSLARKETVDATLNEDYDRANDLKRAIEIISDIIHLDKVNFSDENMTNNLKNRLENAKITQKEIESHFDEIINRQKEEENNRKEQLQQIHDNEIRKLQEYWQSTEAMLPFAKPSAELLQIRKMQKAYAISHDFTNAKIMKLRAENLQKIETQEAQKKALAAMKNEYEQLLEKHRKEDEAGEMNWQRKLETLEMEKKAALKANENLEKQLTLKIEGPKREKRKSVILPIIERRESIYTNKMRKKYAEYKKCPEKMRLEIRMDSQNIIKPKAKAGGKTPRKRNYD